MDLYVDCIFCDIIKGNRRGFFVYEDETHVAILDRYPIDVGHCLIIPRDHHELIIDMESDAVVNLFSKVPKIAKGILRATDADGFSIAQNNGIAAKQIIPHVHVHIIPRYSAKGTVWTKRNISSDNELSDLAKKIRKNIIS